MPHSEKQHWLKASSFCKSSASYGLNFLPNNCVVVKWVLPPALGIPHTEKVWPTWGVCTHFKLHLRAKEEEAGCGKKTWNSPKWNWRLTKKKPLAWKWHCSQEKPHHADNSSFCWRNTKCQPQHPQEQWKGEHNTIEKGQKVGRLSITILAVMLMRLFCIT